MTRAALPRAWLLDANLLIALTHASHVHHGEAHAWFEKVGKRRWASCALTQLAFVRLTSNPRVVGESISPVQAMEALASMTAHALHEYWADAPEPLSLPTLNSVAVVGHRQVTDAYLLGLAVLRGQCLATLDRGLLTFAQASGQAEHIELVSARAQVQKRALPYQAARKAHGG